MSNDPGFTTTTISVFTRHSPDCTKKTDKNWKRCDCRKWLYVYEDGLPSRISAKTRSWEQAERFAQAERDRRDPVRRKLQETEDEKVRQVAFQKSKDITVADAVDRWLASLRFRNEVTGKIYGRAGKRIKDWATGQGLENLSDVTADMLDLWRGYTH
jgi:hypothetical protein